MGLKTVPHPTFNWLGSRAILILCATVVFTVTAAFLCGGNFILFISVLLTDGIIAAAWITGACALGLVIFRRFKFQIETALLIPSCAGLGLGIYSLAGLALGLAGWLNRPVAIAFPVVSILLWSIEFLPEHARFNRGVVRRWISEPARAASWLWLVPAVSLAIALVSASYLPGILWKPLDPHPYDVTGYHLLVPREWFEMGRIVPLEHNVYSFFEFNVEIQFLLLMHAMGGPFSAMYACQFLCAGYATLMVVAVMGSVGNQKSHNHFARVLAAALVGAVPWVIMLAGVAYVESALMFYTALAVAWALYAIGHPQQWTVALLLSGTFAGLACGVKITAVPMLLLALPVGLFCVLMIRKPSTLSVKRLIVGCAGVIVAGSVAVSPWLMRNWAWAGNPLFPVGMHALGRDHFDDVQVKRFHDAHSPTAAQKSMGVKMQILYRDVLTHWQFGYVILPMGLVACLLGRRDRQTWLVLICGLFVLVVWIGFTHLLPRFLVMLVPISGIAIARIHWHRAWPLAVILLMAAGGLAWSVVIQQLQGQPPIMGQEDTTFMLHDSPQLVAARDRKMQIGLVGDAEAFLYPIPLKRLHYRAVFNLKTGTNDPVKAWVGSEPIGNPNWLLVINPSEVQRLHNTYFGVPGLPREWAGRGDDVFFLRGDALFR